MQLHSFFNSSTSYRVRIALALKGIAYETLPVNIRTSEHRAVGYVASVNPSALVPTLIDRDFRLGQSLAIIDYLDRQYPEQRLIPLEPNLRARVLEFSLLIACEIHPVNNLRILRYLETELKVTPQQKTTWYRHWIAEGMGSAERLLERSDEGPWCFGAQPTLADVCLVPQIANALRMECDLRAYPRALDVYEHASKHAAFEAAQPLYQPDYSA
ncbi:maleylacetoacetate isomerase [Paraburkholderia ginsengiterrae]|uniref:Maleylacetoacetate isomerase n=1 Tax=Paraburkholderia ginsengiterrae TaxID=1462993 RepID=A0A1A9NAE8_9BURK|nr:maleylacetoacetate isomerase [Paraburkholderia ginsengiterrae]OAJ62552.1 maleylacetoacetate isomerase [Paraburkholderia ginsengiterrae]OAJ62673.1 maleylacetoacetate isomerase [Paraburkholderia ginsengiterrae]